MPETNIFRKMLGPKKCAELDKLRARIKERRTKLKKMNNEQLADNLEYTIVNSGSCRKKLALSTYDDALIHVYLPEILRRLRGKDETKNNHGNLSERIQKHDKELHPEMYCNACELFLNECIATRDSIFPELCTKCATNDRTTRCRYQPE